MGPDPAGGGRQAEQGNPAGREPAPRASASIHRPQMLHIAETQFPEDKPDLTKNQLGVAASDGNEQRKKNEAQGCKPAEESVKPLHQATFGRRGLFLCLFSVVSEES